MREQPPFQVRDRNKCVYCHKSLNVSDVVSFNQFKKYNETYKEAPAGRGIARALYFLNPEKTEIMETTIKNLKAYIKENIGDTKTEEFAQYYRDECARADTAIKLIRRRISAYREVHAEGAKTFCFKLAAEVKNFRALDVDMEGEYHTFVSNRMIKESVQKLEQLKLKKDGQIARMEKKHKLEIMQLKLTLRKEMEKTQKLIKKEKKEAQTLHLQEKNEETALHNREMQEIKTGHKKEMQKITTGHSTAKKQEIARVRGLLATLQRKMHEKIALCDEQTASQVQSHKDVLASQLQSRKDEAKQKLRDDIRKLNKWQREKYQEKEEKLEENIKKMDLRFEDKLAKQQQTHQRRIDKLKAEHDEEIAQFKRMKRDEMCRQKGQMGRECNAEKTVRARSSTTRIVVKRKKSAGPQKNKTNKKPRCQPREQVIGTVAEAANKISNATKAIVRKLPPTPWWELRTVGKITCTYGSNPEFTMVRLNRFSFVYEGASKHWCEKAVLERHDAVTAVEIAAPVVPNASSVTTSVPTPPPASAPANAPPAPAVSNASSAAASVSEPPPAPLAVPVVTTPVEKSSWVFTLTRRNDHSSLKHKTTNNGTATVDQCPDALNGNVWTTELQCTFTIGWDSCKTISGLVRPAKNSETSNSLCRRAHCLWAHFANKVGHSVCKKVKDTWCQVRKVSDIRCFYKQKPAFVMTQSFEYTFSFKPDNPNEYEGLLEAVLERDQIQVLVDVNAAEGSSQPSWTFTLHYQGEARKTWNTTVEGTKQADVSPYAFGYPQTWNSHCDCVFDPQGLTYMSTDLANKMRKFLFTQHKRDVDQLKNVKSKSWNMQRMPTSDQVTDKDLESCRPPLLIRIGQSFDLKMMTANDIPKDERARTALAKAARHLCG